VAIEAGESLCVAGETVWLLSEDHEDVPFCPQATLFPSTAWAPDQLLHPPKKRTPKGWKKVLSRGEAGRAYFMSESTGWNAPFAVSPQKPALSSLPEDRERFPCALWLRDTLQAGVRRLELSSAAMRLPAAPTRKAGYLPDGSNLPYVIARLKREDPRRHALWVAHVREALPDLETITTAEREEDRHRYLIVRYRNGLEAPSWLVSDGTLRMLALTLLAYTPDVHQGIYLVEEPENGVHPRAVETVFQSLSSVYEAQVLLATHSPVILGMAELDDLLCFARDNQGAAAVVAGREHPRLKEWKGAMNLGDLFAMGVLG
jgi:hypothetical protein